MFNYDITSEEFYHQAYLEAMAEMEMLEAETEEAEAE